MTKPMPLAQFTRLPPALHVEALAGLSGAIDLVAARAPESHRFLRYGWYDAAIRTYGGTARTLIVQCEGAPVIALPIAAMGAPWTGWARVPGSYWPFRSFPAAADAGLAAFDALLGQLAREAVVLRLGPIYDDDPVLHPMRRAAQAAGWTVIDRFVADSYRLDMAAAAQDGGWPRASTRKKNRFHEKHLATHGALEWSFVTGAEWSAARFDALAEIERQSWIATRTDGRDAKFTLDGHGGFWRAVADDPVIADMLWAAVLTIDGRPTAFSFDLNTGALKYAIANSYDPVVGKHSPGKLLYYRNLIRAMADGIKMVDWGAGDSGYKRTIGAVPGPAIRDWLFVRPGVAASLARLMAGWWARSGNSRHGTAAEAED
ncbi:MULTISPECIES: GNAT family N-acetyltransferase [unclassified Sphingomonas]|uniref:GNAT family N-acetyltransferase n=1 Tax=unclassified Sphingomonas TaxID=196159 RepID=UPI0008310444|nr:MULTISPECIES: GNAT family N-acetyltransferase [unclassified Sphingomonas]